MWWIPSSRTDGRLARRAGRLRRRQLEPERRALVLDAGEADAAPVGLDDVARHRQPEADARNAARLRLAPEELREDARLVLLGDAQPLVLDEHSDDLAVELPGDGDLPAFRRVLDRVRDQVDHDLGDPLAVAEHLQPVLGDVDDDLVVAGLVGEQVRFSAQERAEIVDRRGQLETTLVRLFRGQELLDQAGQPAALVVDDLDVAPQRVGLRIPAEDQAGVPEDAGQRRPQLVRDDRDQLRLRTLALPQLLVLDLQRAAALLDGLGHRVERGRQLADLRRAALRDADRQVAGGDLRRAARDVAHRPGDRADEVARDQEEQEARGGEGEAADEDRAVRPAARGGRVRGDEPVLSGQQPRQPPPDVPDPGQALARRRRRERVAGAEHRDLDQQVAVVRDVRANLPDDAPDEAGL